MWLLECDGDLLGGKALWLKPGSRYLFGRTAGVEGPNEHSRIISNKTVSRKHLVFAVAPSVHASVEIYKPSTLTITDDSKLGTEVDGVKLVKESKVLTGKEHKIRLGSYEQGFKVTWRPIVLTLHGSDKDQRQVLDPVRKKLESFDIKVTLPYIIDATTHFVTSKRNSPKSLQALINGKHIVTDSFIDALAKACTSRGLAQDGVTPLSSPLEEDYISHWPNESAFLPGPGKEQHPRPAEKFAPNPNRISIFEGFTFVFADKVQFDQLQAALTNGGAKALLCNVTLGQTLPEEFVKFVRNAAEEKGLQDINDSNTSKGVVVVRLNVAGETEQLGLEFLQYVDLELGQRSIMASEFLDAILQDDARPLKRALEEDVDERPTASTAPEPSFRTSRRARNSLPDSVSNAQVEDMASQATPPAKKIQIKGIFRRMVVKSRFKGLDDFGDEEDDDLPLSMPFKSLADGTNPQSQSQRHEARDSQSLFVDESQSDHPGPMQGSAVVEEASRKRPREEEDGEAHTAMLDNLIPGAAMAKKRRIEREAELAAEQAKQPARTDTSQRDEAEASQLANATSKRTKKEPSRKESAKGVLEAVRSHAEKRDAEFARGKGVKAEPNSEIEPDQLETLKDLAIVEFMEIPQRRRPVGAGRADDGNAEPANERWDDRWNGLKNFKNFRRKGERSEAAHNRARKVVIGLEEYKAPDLGIGDRYWAENQIRDGRAKSQPANGKRAKQTYLNPAPQQVDFEDDDSDDSDHDDADVDMAGLDAVLIAAREAGVKAKNSRKRPAAAAGVAKQPPAKRQQRQTTLAPMRTQVDEDSSDDDENKFRFVR